MGRLAESFMSEPQLSKEAGEKELLDVALLWHEQVHHSRVARLELSLGGDRVLSGCDGATPKLVERPEPSVAVVCAKTGKGLTAVSTPTPANVRCLVPGAQGLQRVLCTASDGALFCMDLQDGSVAGTAALPNTPAANKPSSSDPEPAAMPNQGLALPQQQQQQPQQQQEPQHDQQPLMESSSPASGPPSASLVGPEFVGEAGFRGHREGYLFREGGRGSGYYRKDTLLLHKETPASNSGRGGCSSSGGGGSSSGEGVSSVGAGSTDAQPGADPGHHDTVHMGSSCSATSEDEQQQRVFLQRLGGAPAGMHSVIASANGSRLFTSSLGADDTSIRVWRCEGDLWQLRPVLHRTLCGHSAGVLALTQSPCGGLLFSGSYDHTIRVWSTADWSCIRVLKGHGGGIRALAASPDGRVLYSAAGDNTIRAWSTQHWVCLRTLHGRHGDATWPCCMALSSDGRLLATGSTGPFGGSTIKLFQTHGGQGREAGACLDTFSHLAPEDKGDTTALVFSQDGTVLYSGASDGTLAAWQLTWRAAQPVGKHAGLRKGFL